MVEPLGWSSGLRHELSPPFHVVSGGPTSLIEIYVYFIHVLECPFLSSWFAVHDILSLFYFFEYYAAPRLIVLPFLPPPFSSPRFPAPRSRLEAPRGVHAPFASRGIIVTAVTPPPPRLHFPRVAALVLSISQGLVSTRRQRGGKEGKETGGGGGCCRKERQKREFCCHSHVVTLMKV